MHFSMFVSVISVVRELLFFSGFTRDLLDLRSNEKILFLNTINMIDDTYDCVFNFITLRTSVQR